MREAAELKRVLSPRISVLKKSQQCDFCSRDLEKGSAISNYGVIDRQHRTWSRVYYCTDHAEILDNLNNEDLPEFAQQYLIENGFTNEFYGR
jgi:hypothetical protein